MKRLVKMFSLAESVGRLNDALNCVLGKKRRSTLLDKEVILAVETIEKKTAKKKMSAVMKFQDVRFFICCFPVFL
jgi:hypothetical protein